MSYPPERSSANAMERLSGDHEYELTCEPRCVSWIARPSSSDVTHTSDAPSPFLLSRYASHLPSGEYVGWCGCKNGISPMSTLSGVGNPPVALTVQRSEPPSGEANMMRLPSGDHCGVAVPTTEWIAVRSSGLSGPVCADTACAVISTTTTANLAMMTSELP